MRQAGCSAYDYLLLAPEPHPRVRGGLTLLMTFTRMQTHINHLRLSVLTATKKADGAEEICEYFLFFLLFVWFEESTWQGGTWDDKDNPGPPRRNRGLSADNRFALVNQSNSYSFRNPILLRFVFCF